MELLKNIIQQFYYILSIFIFFVFLFMYYTLATNEKYSKYLKGSTVSLNDLTMELINPDCENKNNPSFGIELSMLYKSVCSNGRSIDDFNFVEFILFIFLGAGIICYEINEKILNYAGEIIYNAGNIKNLFKSSVPDQKTDQTEGPLMDDGISLPKSNNSNVSNIFLYNVLPIFLMYLFLDFITTLVKERFVELNKMFGNKFNPVTKNKIEKMYIGKEISKSFLALLISIIVGIIIINCIAYILFLVKGMTSSNTSKITYFAILLGLPFVLSSVNINLTVIEGNKNSKKSGPSIGKTFKKDGEIGKAFKKDSALAKSPVGKTFKKDGEIGKNFKKDGATAKAFKKDGAIGKNFKKDGALAKSFKKDGAIGKAFKKNNNKKESDKRKKHKERDAENFSSKPVTCTSYNYIWYFVGYFIVPICISIYTIFKFLFVGLGGVSQIFTQDFSIRIACLAFSTLFILIFVILSEVVEFYYNKYSDKINNPRKLINTVSRNSTSMTVAPSL